VGEAALFWAGVAVASSISDRIEITVRLMMLRVFKTIFRATKGKRKY
jgi:hypothetical protein